MAVIQSGASTDVLTVDPTSKAARITLYNSAGVEQSAAPLSTAAIVDSNNTTVVALGASGSFIGVATDILAYRQINISIFGRPGVVAGDGLSAKGSFWFDFSKDGVNWETQVPSFIRDPSLIIPIPLIFVHRYFRVRYFNDGGAGAIAALGLNETAGTPTAQTQFSVTTYLLPASTKELTRTMDQGISGSDACGLVRAGIMAKTPNQLYQNIEANARRALKVDITSDIATYSAAVVGLAPAASATDIFTIAGSATKTISIFRIQVSATRTVAGTADILLVKRSSANTGGTFTSLVSVPHDSSNLPASATIQAYTANPVLGALVGNVSAFKTFISTSLALGERSFLDWGIRPAQPIILRGINEVLAINLSGTTIVGGSFNIFIEWTGE